MVDGGAQGLELGDVDMLDVSYVGGAPRRRHPLSDCSARAPQPLGLVGSAGELVGWRWKGGGLDRTGRRDPRPTGRSGRVRGIGALASTEALSVMPWAIGDSVGPRSRRWTSHFTNSASTTPSPRSGIFILW